MKKKEKKTRKPFDFKAQFNNADYGNGLRSVLICVMAILLVVAVNVLIGALPSTALHVDISATKVHSLSDETKHKVENLDKKIEVFLVCEAGEEDKNTEFMLARYADLHDQLTVEAVDPVFQPLFVEQYAGRRALENNTVIVVCGERKQVIPYDQYVDSGVFVLEDYMNKALDYVTGAINRVAYLATGEKMVSLSAETIAYMGMDGFDVKTFNLAEEAVPEEANVVILNGVKEDLTMPEVKHLLDYAKQGGRILLSTAYSTKEMTNLERFTARYGAKLSKGIIMETAEGRYIENNPAFLVPSIYTEGNDVLTEGVEYVLFPEAKGILLAEEEAAGTERHVILETTEQAYNYYTNALTGKSTSEPGKYNLGVAWTKAEGNQTTSRLIWYASQYLSNEEVDTYAGGGNLTLYLNSVCWLGEDEPEASIYGKRVATQFLHMTNAMTKVMGVIFLAVPLLVVAIGMVVWIRRKRRSC